MKDRLIQLLTKEGLSATKFADLLGVQRSNISHIISGRNKPSYDFIEKIMLKFPEINPEWLILGKGKMYTNEIKTEPPIPVSKEPTLFENTVNTRSAATKQTTEFIKENKPLKTQVNEMVTNVNISIIERIVIFYSDKSFMEYKPQ